MGVRVALVVGVIVDVSKKLDVPLRMCVPDSEDVADAVGDDGGERLPVPDGETPCVRVAVAVPVKLLVNEMDTLGVVLSEAVAVAVADAPADAVSVADALDDAVAVADAPDDTVAVADTDNAVSVAVALDDAVAVADVLAVLVALPLPDALPVLVPVLVKVSLPDTDDAVAVADADTPDDAVFLPGRNVLLLAKPLLWCLLNGVRELATAPLASNPFPDATPEFYADYNYSNWLLAPTPDAAYPMEVLYYELPALLDDVQQSNWLTEYAPQLLLYATLLEATPFLKNDERIGTWQTMYDRAAASLSGEDLAKILDRAAVRKEA